MYNVFGFYKFKKVKNLKKLKSILYTLVLKYKIKGTIILSSEGINGSISGYKNDILLTQKKLKKILLIKKFDSENFSKSKFNPFHRAKIKIKNEVVPMGIKVSSFKKTKKHVSPKKCNKLIKKKVTKLIDARKPFEHNVGTFKGSINPNIENFRNFPKYLKKVKKDNKIAIFCTGGIRCEKASAYLIHHGFKNINQLKGGIVQYANDIKKYNEQSKFIGKNFVFDQRLGERITEDIISHCHICSNLCDNHTNCANQDCHILFIQCDKCKNNSGINMKVSDIYINNKLSIFEKKYYPIIKFQNKIIWIPGMFIANIKTKADKNDNILLNWSSIL